MNLLDFINEYDLSLLAALGEHLRLVGVALFAAVVAGVPLGIFSARRPGASGPILTAASLIQTIPSIALFGLMIPVLSLINRGIGAVPATIALVLYAQLPIISNTFTALRQVPGPVIEAARGMGMTERQILLHVSLPLAVPGIIAGIRIATVMSIGVAAVAAYIGAGGLGFFIVRGISIVWDTMIIAGALGIALLALLIELLLGLAERALAPPGSRGGKPSEGL